MKIVFEEIVENLLSKETEKRFKTYSDISIASTGLIYIGEEIINTGNGIDILVKNENSAVGYTKYKKMTDEAYQDICKLIKIAIDKNKTLKIRLEKYTYTSVINGFIDISI